MGVRQARIDGESGFHGILLSTFCHKSLNLVGALAPAFVETHLFVCHAVGSRPVEHTGGLPRVPALVLKRQDHSHERLFRRLPRLGVSIGDDEPLIFESLRGPTPSVDHHRS
jgi:hypothetical protein